MKWRGKKETGMEISEDLFRLLAAWTDMSREEAFTAEVALGVECSPVSLHESVKYERSMVEGGKSAAFATTILLFVLPAAVSVTKTACF